MIISGLSNLPKATELVLSRCEMRQVCQIVKAMWMLPWPCLSTRVLLLEQTCRAASLEDTAKPPRNGTQQAGGTYFDDLVLKVDRGWALILCGLQGSSWDSDTSFCWSWHLVSYFTVKMSAPEHWLYHTPRWVLPAFSDHLNYFGGEWLEYISWT